MTYICSIFKFEIYNFVCKKIVKFVHKKIVKFGRNKKIVKFVRNKKIVKFVRRKKQSNKTNIIKSTMLPCHTSVIRFYSFHHHSNKKKEKLCMAKLIQALNKKLKPVLRQILNKTTTLVVEDVAKFFIKMEAILISWWQPFCFTWRSHLLELEKDDYVYLVRRYLPKYFCHFYL